MGYKWFASQWLRKLGRQTLEFDWVGDVVQQGSWAGATCFQDPLLCWDGLAESVRFLKQWTNFSRAAGFGLWEC